MLVDDVDDVRGKCIYIDNTGVVDTIIFPTVGSQRASYSFLRPVIPNTIPSALQQSSCVFVTPRYVADQRTISFRFAARLQRSSSRLVKWSVRVRRVKSNPDLQHASMLASSRSWATMQNFWSAQ